MSEQGFSRPLLPKRAMQLLADLNGPAGQAVIRTRSKSLRPAYRTVRGRAVSIVFHAHHLGTEPVAEGGGRAATLALLRENGCQRFQDWLFRRAA